MTLSTSLPVSLGTSDNFSKALMRSTVSNSLFSGGEKRILAALCVTAFSLPLLTSAVLLHRSSNTNLLSAPVTQEALLPQGAGNVAANSDELAMASYFMDKAGSVDKAEGANLLSQAQAILDSTQQTGEKVTAAKNQLATLLGTPNQVTPGDSVQRVAGAATPTGSQVAGSLTSNAVGSTLTMPAGTSSLVVKAPGVTDSAQVYLAPENNRENAIIYVKNKQAGVGFTLESTAPLSHDVNIKWYQISNP